MNILFDKHFITFVTKFLLLFALLYFGTLGIIGLAAPGKLYSPFVDQHLDYVSGIKNALMYGTKGILNLFGITTVIEPNFTIRFIRARGVIISMNCVGYGVYSFWIAYVAANKGNWQKKLAWIAGGLLLLFAINTIRITLFLTAINKGWPMPLGIDHHTWFTVFAYGAIFGMIFLLNHRSEPLSLRESKGHKKEEEKPVTRGKRGLKRS